MIKGFQYFKVYDEHQLEYVLIAGGGSEDIYMIGKLAAFQIENLLIAYKERFDKDNFIKNLLLDNLLFVDIYNRAKKLHIEVNARRVVFYTGDQSEQKITICWNALKICSMERTVTSSQQSMKRISLSSKSSLRQTGMTK